ncbi:MAG: CHC2 zinc finger domain-containing protein [Alphaproteobacteria bacterium]|nr:CHC2 zinc finger domain-containing protein [Alphaproteobacteria bacterium]
MNGRRIGTDAVASVFREKASLKQVEANRSILLQDIEQANAAHDLVALVGEKVRLARNGDKWRGVCPFHGDQRLSTFTVNPKTNRYACSVCGAEGDALSWIMETQGLSFAQVVALSLKKPLIEPCRLQKNVNAALTYADPPPSDEAMRQHKREMAEKIWRESQLPAHSLVERYLYTRGLNFNGAFPPSIRFHPNLYHEPSRMQFPAMVAMAQTIDGAFAGIHRTYLAPSGIDSAHVAQGGARRMYGECFGAFVHIQEKSLEKIVITETVESALTIAQACPDLTVYASMALNNLKARAPKEAKELILCPEGNNGNPHMAERILVEAAMEHIHRGHRVLVARAPQGLEFSDLLLAQ